MKWIVRGTYAATGDDSTLIIDAPNEAGGRSAVAAPHTTAKESSRRIGPNIHAHNIYAGCDNGVAVGDGS
jgi:hypothetical protein